MEDAPKRDKKEAARSALIAGLAAISLSPDHPPGMNRASKNLEPPKIAASEKPGEKDDADAPAAPNKIRYRLKEGNA